eukprot:GHVN01056416.1.p1 GENE.GHVN01056416.1~~GHVN01056416.1.p1  ORF type:complete len:145 (-),score=35.47 GHVN01056416.1:1830-2264(-)
MGDNKLTSVVSDYLLSLDVPSTWDQLTSLTSSQQLRLLPLIVSFTLFLVGGVYVVHFITRGIAYGSSHLTQSDLSVNESEKEKVTFMTLTDIEEMCKGSSSGKCSICRCWKSKTFPKCDGSHRQIPVARGVGVGPFVIMKELSS